MSKPTRMELRMLLLAASLTATFAVRVFEPDSDQVPPMGTASSVTSSRSTSDSTTARRRSSGSARTSAGSRRPAPKPVGPLRPPPRRPGIMTHIVTKGIKGSVPEGTKVRKDFEGDDMWITEGGMRLELKKNQITPLRPHRREVHGKHHFVAAPPAKKKRLAPLRDFSRRDSLTPPVYVEFEKYVESLPKSRVDDNPVLKFLPDIKDLDLNAGINDDIEGNLNNYLFVGVAPHAEEKFEEFESFDVFDEERNLFKFIKGFWREIEQNELNGGSRRNPPRGSRYEGFPCLWMKWANLVNRHSHDNIRVDLYNRFKHEMIFFYKYPYLKMIKFFPDWWSKLVEVRNELALQERAGARRASSPRARRRSSRRSK